MDAPAGEHRGVLAAMNEVTFGHRGSGRAKGSLAG